MLALGSGLCDGEVGKDLPGGRHVDGFDGSDLFGPVGWQLIPRVRQNIIGNVNKSSPAADGEIEVCLHGVRIGDAVHQVCELIRRIF